MAETETEAVSTSAFKVRPASKPKAEGSRQKAEDSSLSPQSFHGQAERSRLHQLTAELRQLEAKLRQGGGPERIEKQHKQGKLTARERIDLLLDKDSYRREIGLLVAWDQYKEQGAKGKGEREKRKTDGSRQKAEGSEGIDDQIGAAPAAGVVTTIGRVCGREIVVVANDATVKAGSWWPETIKKILRAQEIAMRCHVPIVYLVDSAGVNLPYQGGVFPGQYGAARIFYYNSIMRRYLRVPQLAAVMGPCIAGGAYLPALSDVIVMVKGTSFMGLGGPNLVKGATGQTIDAETLGGAVTHTQVSAVAHYRAANDTECLARIREYIGRLPRLDGLHHQVRPAVAPARSPADLYELLPHDHRLSYDMRQVLACLIDGGALD